MILKRNGTWKCLSVVTLRAGVSRFSGRKFPVKDGCRFSNWRKSARCCFVAAASASLVAPPLARNPPHGAASPTDRPNARAQSRIVRGLFLFFRGFVASSHAASPLLCFCFPTPRLCTAATAIRETPPSSLPLRPRRGLPRSVRPSVRPNSENGNDGWHGLRVSMRASQRTPVLPDASRKPLPRPGPFSNESAFPVFRGISQDRMI